MTNDELALKTKPALKFLPAENDFKVDYKQLEF
jgi:hypothetical protein